MGEVLKLGVQQPWMMKGVHDHDHLQDFENEQVSADQHHGKVLVGKHSL